MGQEIIRLVREAGVVGAGGAGFPTHVKIGSRAALVIVNGAECEPLLRVDQQLMARMPRMVVKGLEAVMAVTGAAEGVIALKAKYHEAVEALAEVIKGKSLRLFTLEDYFPAGDEQMLVHEVSGMVVPEGGIPLKVGCVVINVETAINVAHALDGEPVTHTHVTIAGEVSGPATLSLPIGTPVVEALSLAGAGSMADMAVIEGGPMMGQLVSDLSQPVVKTTKGLLVLPIHHPLVRQRTSTMAQMVRRAKSVCIQCAACTEVCPRYLLGHSLEPHKIMRSLNYLQGDVGVLKMALLCCECGACEVFGCVMQLSPRQVNAAIKRELAGQGVKTDGAAGSPKPSPLRIYRQIPANRLVARLGLTAYDRPAPLSLTEYYPQMVRIPLKQHTGAPGVPVVKVGQRVGRGTLIAGIPEGALGANIHASISGIVAEVSDSIVIVANSQGGEAN